MLNSVYCVVCSEEEHIMTTTTQTKTATMKTTTTMAYARTQYAMKIKICCCGWNLRVRDKNFHLFLVSMGNFAVRAFSFSYLLYCKWNTALFMLSSEYLAQLKQNIRMNDGKWATEARELFKLLSLPPPPPPRLSPKKLRNKSYPLGMWLHIAPLRNDIFWIILTFLVLSENYSCTVSSTFCLSLGIQMQ